MKLKRAAFLWFQIQFFSDDIFGIEDPRRIKMKSWFSKLKKKLLKKFS